MIWYSDGGLDKICACDSLGNVFIDEINGTNNENEYRAMILALSKCSSGDEVRADSMLVVCQLSKGWKVKKPHLKHLFEKARSLYKGRGILLTWVPREENKAGIILEDMKNAFKKGWRPGTSKSFTEVPPELIPRRIPEVTPEPELGALTALERKELEVIWNRLTDYGKKPMSYEVYLDAGLEIMTMTYITKRNNLRKEEKCS